MSSPEYTPKQIADDRYNNDSQELELVWFVVRLKLEKLYEMKSSADEIQGGVMTRPESADLEALRQAPEGAIKLPEYDDEMSRFGAFSALPALLKLAAIIAVLWWVVRQW